MNINSLVDKYYLSSDFNMLTEKTKVDYSNCLSIMLNTNIDDKFIYTTKVNKLTGAVARQSYELWLKRGIYMANHICATSRKVYSFGMEMGYAEVNPFSTFKCSTYSYILNILYTTFPCRHIPCLYHGFYFLSNFFFVAMLN